MTFIDLFSGVGGFRLGMEQAGHTCLGHCEIDKFANWSYTAMHLLDDAERQTLQTMNVKTAQKYMKSRKQGDEWYAKDIRKVRADDIPRADCWCFGFPCQDISVAGIQTGFKGNRSSLFFAVTRLIRDLKEENKPSYLLIENVKNLFSVNRGLDFLKLLIELDEIGYDAEWQLVNSKDYGVPQNRERVFIVGHFRGRCTGTVFPIAGTNAKTLERLIGGKQGKRVYNPNGLSCALAANGGGFGTLTGLYAIPVLTPDRAEKRQNGRRFKKSGDPMFTLTSQDRHGVAIYQKTIFPSDKNGNAYCLDANYSKGITFNQQRSGVLDGTRIRKLTPRECFRLQGFPDPYFDRARLVNSDHQLYKQAGNGVTVPVVYQIARRMKGSTIL